MKIIAKLFRKKKPQYGWKIFEQKSWLTRQVEDAQFNQFKKSLYRTK